MSEYKCICSEKSGVMAEILSVQPSEYIEPEKANGIFEVTGELMNEFERKAFTVVKRCQIIIKEKTEQIKLVEKENRSLKREVEVLIDKRIMISNLMFFSIQDRLNIWGGSSLGVSEGFKIIIPDEDENISTKSVAIGIPKEVIIAAIEAIKEFKGISLDDLIEDMKRTKGTTIH